MNRSRNAVIEELKKFMNSPNWKLYNTMYNQVGKYIKGPPIHNTIYGISEVSNWNLKIKLLDVFTLEDVLTFHKKYFENEKLGYKIRQAQMQKIPYMLVIGDKEMEAGTVAPRVRDGKNLDALTVEQFIDLMKEMWEKKK
jgi:hypothetical protein